MHATIKKTTKLLNYNDIKTRHTGKKQKAQERSSAKIYDQKC